MQIKYGRKKNRSLLMLTAIVIAAFTLPLSAQSIVIRDGFEINYDGWTNNGGCTRLTAVRGAGYNSARAMMVTDRKSPQDGAASDKGFYLESGETYNYNVYVKHAGAFAETFNLTLRWLMPDGKTYGSEVIATKAVMPNEWTQLAASYAAPRESTNPTFFITTNSTIDFYFDEFTAAGRSAPLAKAANTPANVGLKDIYANHFRVGNIFNGRTINDNAIRNLMLLEYNSVTAENEHKPDATMTRTNSTNTNIRAAFNTGAAAIMNFCAQNNIPMRGHVLAWHGQTPDWFFIQDINDARGDRNNANAYRNGSVSSVPWATPAVMNQRLESYIQNIFALYAQQYPSLHLYAYDVVNEASTGEGGMRPRGFDHNGAGGQGASNAGDSPWQGVYGAGNTTWIRNAFTYARRYAPDHTKLFYNDFNEWQESKRDYIINNILKPLYQDGILDGMGMQGHVNADPGANAWSRWSRQEAAMDAYAAIGAGFEIQITEMEVAAGPDANNPTQWLNLQPERYRRVFEHAIAVNARGGGQFTAICIWGPNDANTWISGNREPTLHNRQNQRKPAYDAVAGVVPESQWGDGNNPTFGNGGQTNIYSGKNAKRGQLPLAAVKGRTLTVNALDDSEVNIRIVNLTGRTVASFNANGRSNVSLRNIPAGMYIIEARQVKNGMKMTSNAVLR